MKLQWNYTTLAPYYDKRADYSNVAIDSIIRTMSLQSQDVVADVGAGTGKLTSPLLQRGLQVHAVEPNDAMREFGKKNTLGRNVIWTTGTGEETGLPSDSMKAFLMGSSFNVVDQAACLKEAYRTLQACGYFVCMWNHRDFNDPLQAAIENVIKDNISEYNYGKRREDPSQIICESELFTEPLFISHRFITTFPISEFVDGWRSHATLQRQSDDKFESIIEQIEAHLAEKEFIDVPYTTNIWLSQKK